MADVSTKHPSYSAHVEQYETIRVCTEGPEAVKNEGVKFLPMPTGYVGHTQQDNMYNAYRMRAQFPDILNPTVAGMVGVIHRVEAEIQGLEEGTPLYDLWERCTQRQEGGKSLTLEAFHQQITENILRYGRLGVLVDVAKEGADLPYFELYHAESIINWNKEGTFFVLDESGETQEEEFLWKHQERYRVLRVRDGTYSQQEYHVREAQEEIFPSVRGGRTLEQIPFTVVNTKTVDLKPEEPPVMGIARSSLAIYRTDADYRLSLFMSAQETLFISGIDDSSNLPKGVGAGIIVGLPLDGKAEYVGIKGEGIEAMEKSMANDREAAIAAGARIFDSFKKEAESGDALRLRYSAQTATMTTIAMASAMCLEASLRHAARFVGQDPEEIIVKPNLKFMESRLPPGEVKELVAAWMAGAISYETLYMNLQRGEIASAERTADEEKEQIEKEMPDEPIHGAPLTDPETGHTLPDPNAPPPGEIVEDEE